jgi:hypothetical protein
MRRQILTVSWVFAAAAGGCKSSDSLPPATEWQTSPVPTGSGAEPVMPPAIGVGGRRATPHSRMGASNDPHAGINLGGADDPHAGLDMSSVDVTKLGFKSPDPDRPIDPTRRVTGLITADGAAKSGAKTGTSIFLVVKRAGPNGAPVGSALAVDKLTWNPAGVPFELTDANAMIAGTELTGDVIVTARYDQDSDALSKQAGDIVGQARVKIPADHVKLTLDTILP